MKSRLIGAITAITLGLISLDSEPATARFKVLPGLQDSMLQDSIFQRFDPAASPGDTASFQQIPASQIPASPRPIDVIDRVQTNSDFDQFRDRLRQAIRNRDSQFIRSILPPEGVEMGLGGAVPVAALDLHNRDSWFWHTLEKMLLLESCELDSYPGSIPDAAVWVCPNVANTFYRQYPSPEQMDTVDYGLQQVVVMGRRVNVRSQPSTRTSVVGVLSNEVVTFDQFTWDQLHQTRQDSMVDPLTGWTPVILPDQTRGYVYNRYVYQPLDPRGLFENTNGRWQLFRILAGD